MPLLRSTVLTIFLGLLLAVTQAKAQTFQIGPGAPTDYPVFFQAFENNCVETPTEVNCRKLEGASGNTDYGTHIDLNPSNYGYLAVFIPDGTVNAQGIAQGVVKRVFPIEGVHDALVDHPLGEKKYALSDMSPSLDGQALLITFHHNVAQLAFQTNENNLGSDIYRLDLSQLNLNRNNTAWNPATQMPVKRLTTQPSDPNLYALNPITAPQTFRADRVRFTGPTEVLDAQGQPMLIFASDLLRVLNANFGNRHRQNLLKANYDANGNLKNINFFEYSTTSSAVSPISLPNGVLVSRSESFDRYGFNRKWHVVYFSSSGMQQPGLGYGHPPSTAFHSQGAGNPGTGIPGDDVLVTAGYYSGSANNQGMGGFLAIRERDRGLNTELRVENGNVSQVREVRQKNEYLIFGNVSIFQDDPSLTQNGEWVGKASTPYLLSNRHLYYTWCKDACNSRVSNILGPDGRRHNQAYRSKIARIDDYTLANQNILTASKVVVEDTTRAFSLVRPIIVQPLSQRFARSPSPATREYASAYPFGRLGTSNLRNSDIRHFHCFDAFKVTGANSGGFAMQDFLSSSTMPSANGIDTRTPLQVFDTNLTLAQACSGFPNSNEQVGWLAYYQTSDKTNMQSFLNASEPGLSKPEIHTLLGLVRTFNETGRNSDDTSALATIPANVPVTMVRLHRQYGLKTHQAPRWLDVQEGEQRNDCGGCHGHTDYNAQNVVPFENTHAGNPTTPPVDTVNQTIDIDYDANCNAIEKITPDPAIRPPVWEDVFPGFVQNCTSCHSAGQSGAPAFVVTPTSSAATLSALAEKMYVDRKGFLMVALAQQTFWAARGRRTDGLDNNFYRNHTTPHKRQYVYSNVHDTLNLCNGTNPDGARWVLKLGQWLDHGAFSQDDWAGDYYDDVFHPTFAATAPVCTNPSQVQVRVWDDSGTVARIQAYRQEIGSSNLVQERVASAGQPLTNQGVYNFDLSSVPANQKIVFVVTDAAGNRQFLQTDAERLARDCQIIENGGSLPPPTNNTAFLNIQKQNVQVGGQTVYRLTMTVDVPTATGNLMVALPGTRLGAGTWQVGGNILDITYDNPYSDQTLVQAVGTVVNRQAVITYDVTPAFLNAQGYANVMHQAIVFDAATQQYFGKSAPIEIQVGTPPQTGGGSGSGPGGGAGSGSSGGGSGFFGRGSIKNAIDSAEGEIEGLLGCQSGRSKKSAGTDLTLCLITLILFFARRQTRNT